MTGRPVTQTDELVADYVRSTMRVDVPPALTDEVMRSVAATPQERRTWFSGFGPAAPAFAAVAATALIVAVSIFLFAPRNVGPAPAPTPTPAPTITSAEARVVTQPGDVIRIPALDGEGQFGTITIERGEEKAGYEDFVPIAFEDVFFIELYVTYEPERVTDEEYGEWEFAYVIDVEGDGFDTEELRRGVGFLGMEGQPGFESAPQPILQGMRFGDDVLEGWLVLEIPAVASDYDLYLVYGHGEWTDGIQNMVPDASALLREPGAPVGVSAFDPDYVPPGAGESIAMPSFHVLPTPMPSPASTFEPSADADADALFDNTQSCVNDAVALTVTFPDAWYTNEAYEDLPACSFFAAEPLDAELIYDGLSRTPTISVLERLEWLAGEEPLIERVPIAGRVAWRVTFTEEHQSDAGSHYLIPLTDDPYGPFAHVAGPPQYQALLERMVVRLEFTEE